jgi:hypothetical protein
MSGLTAFDGNSPINPEIMATNRVPGESMPAIIQHQAGPPGECYSHGIENSLFFGRIAGGADAFDAVSAGLHMRARYSPEKIQILKSYVKKFDRNNINALIEVKTERKARVVV